MKRLKDKDIVAGIKADSQKMKELMYRQFRDEFLRWAFRNMSGIDMDKALTIYTDACVAVWDKLRQGRYTLRPNAAFRTYLFQVAKYIWLNRLRAEKKNPSAPTNVEIDRFPDPDVLSENFSDKFLADDISETDIMERKRSIVREVIFQDVQEPCRSIFRYKYYEELSSSEIAEKMSYSDSRSVITAASRCKKKLEIVLTERFRKSKLI